MTSPDEPRMSDERRATVRAALIHVAATFAAGFIVLIAAVSTTGGLHTALLVAGPIVVGLGALSAIARTAIAWRSKGQWQVWQGASWFLLGTTVTWVFGAVPALLS